MKVATKELILKSNGRRITYHNVTQQVNEFIKESGIRYGLCLVQSQHTTCSVIFEEFMHDLDFNGDDYLQVDMNTILDRLIPRELSENTNYRYPGPAHKDFLFKLDHPEHPSDPAILLNGDAHIRSSIFGASETFALNDGALSIGVVGSIYFVDFDQNRVRERTCRIQIMGN
ncbi:YjbQ family protein [Enterococcus sp. AZ196]|uniref:YjbQ family protein n=1 Tax=Enterococcus sp. AZ196 TaxID=2774659 RepID=UPI003D279A47